MVHTEAGYSTVGSRTVKDGVLEIVSQRASNQFLNQVVKSGHLSNQFLNFTLFRN